MSFVPLEYYNQIYHIFIFFVVFIVFIKSFGDKLNARSNINSTNLFGLFLFFVVLFYMGFRPISYQFGDMGSYAKQFQEFKSGIIPTFKKDILFEYLMYFFAQFTNANIFFFFCAFLYVYPLFIISKKLFKEYWFYSFLILLASFSFWAYGTNGIRNGFATSIFLLAICQKRIVFKIVFLAFAVLTHQSLYIPVLAYILTVFYKNNKTYFIIWLMVIPISLVLGNVLEGFFLNLGLGQKEDIQGYLGEFDEDSENVVLKVGFRWDFLVYSASAVYAACFFIYKKKFKDLLYSQFVNIYLTANAFWILVIRANFSNRFAYLSWFMMGLIIIYPLLKVKFYNNQHQVIGLILLVYCFFSFLLNFILG